jgi:hypothetical protein
MYVDIDTDVSSKTFTEWFIESFIRGQLKILFDDSLKVSIEDVIRIFNRDFNDNMIRSFYWRCD